MYTARNWKLFHGSVNPARNWNKSHQKNTQFSLSEAQHENTSHAQGCGARNLLQCKERDSPKDQNSGFVPKNTQFSLREAHENTAHAQGCGARNLLKCEERDSPKDQNNPLPYPQYGPE
jgi:predicted xylose isomerase-like sugar epimerase